MTQGSGGGEAITRNTPGPGGGGVARTGSGDVYAGRDGNVYKKDAGGGWSEANGNSARPDTSTAGQLNRDSAARAEGAQRTRDYSSASSGRTGASSYRPERRRWRRVARRRRRTTAIANTNAGYEGVMT